MRKPEIIAVASAAKKKDAYMVSWDENCDDITNLHIRYNFKNSPSSLQHFKAIPTYAKIMCI